MLKFVAKRLLRFIPVLFCITLLGFVLTSSMPGDPVEQVLIARYGAGIKDNLLGSQKLKEELRAEMGLNKPLFYFSINAYNSCDTLYKIQSPSKKNAMSRLTDQYGCWPEIESYFEKITSLIANKDPAEHHLRSLEIEYDSEGIKNLLQQISEQSAQAARDLETAFSSIKAKKSLPGNYLPTINFHGTDNQYHTWLFGNDKGRNGIIRGDFGLSFQTGEPIDQFIWKKLGYSMELIFFSMILAFALAIPTGMRLSRVKSAKKRDRLAIPIYLMYSIPTYLGGTLLIFFFANDQALHWFPESGLYKLGYHPEEHSYFENLAQAFPFMVLPIITFGYSSFAFVSKLTKNIITEELQQDYVRTAMSKGLSLRQAIRKHVLKNTLIPLITLFTQILPAAVGGTIIIEMIFQYPGLGQAVYESALNSNYPVIIAVFTITGMLTLTAYLLADLLYALVNPKLRPK